MRRRSILGLILVMGACLPLFSGRLSAQSANPLPAGGQREVIATSVAVTPDTPNPPPPQVAPNPPPAQAPSSPPGAIQLASYVPDSPNNVPASQPPPAPLLAPTALLGGMTNGSRTLTTPTTTETTSGIRAPAPAAAVSVEVVGPERLLLGQPLVHEIVIRNMAGRPLADLHVEEPLPAGARVLKTEPPADKRDNRLAWDLHRVETGGERRLKIELDTNLPGDLEFRPVVTFLTGNGLHTQVIRPPFSIEISVDRARVTRGEPVRFQIQLANHSDAPVRNIKLYDALPSGLHHPSGPIISVEHFGDLLPGQVRSLPLETTAVESGTFHNEILAQADRSVEAKGAVDVVVSEPSLSLRQDGPTKIVSQREADFHLEVANPSTLTAKNVRLVQSLPPAIEVISVNPAATLDSNQHALIWTLGDLGSGQRQRVTFRIKANGGGEWPLSAAVSSQNFPEVRVQQSLQTDATAMLKLEVRPREDRLSVGQETVFRIRIFNNGDAPCSGLRLSATVPDALTLVEAEGPSEGRVEKQQIQFSPLAQLEAHGDVVYHLHVSGRQEGRGSLRVDLSADKQSPTQREYSIQVNAANEAARAEAMTGAAAKSVSGATLR